MEWAWKGPEPMNMRLNRFSGIIPFNYKYNVLYTSGAPSSVRYKIIQQQPAGGDSKYYILTTPFSLNMSVQVSNTKGIVDAIISGEVEDSIECGRNKFNNIKN